MYRLSNGLVIFGYILLMSEFFFLPLLFGYDNFGGAPILLIFYGLYYGVLVRDCAEMCTHQMANTLGFKSSKDSLTTRQLKDGVCSICNLPLNSGRPDIKAEESITLNCGHTFHDFCIRGYVIVGKQGICPFCSEKVDLSTLRKGPWATQSHFYAQMLDAIRYLVVWNPAILIGLQIFLRVADWDPTETPMATSG